MSTHPTSRSRSWAWGLLALLGLALTWTAYARPTRPAHHSAGTPARQAALTSVIRDGQTETPPRNARRGAGKAPGGPSHLAARAGRRRAHASASALPFILHSFDGTANDGSNPDGGPLLYVPGLNTVFGTTTGSSGTAQSTTGTIFSFGPGGSAPLQTLATSVGLLNNGLAFGTDSSGAASLFGTNWNGTTPYGEVFGVRLSDDAVSTVRAFDDQQPQFPVTPQAGLVAAPDGYLYGTTRYEYDPSGNYDTTTFGVLYRLKPSDPNGTFEILHRFASDDSEGHPMKGALPCVTASGVVYGVTTAARFITEPDGSTLFQPGEGAIYKYDPATGQFAFVATLGDQTVGTLNFSQSGLVQAGDGFLYGTTDSGGAIGDGTVYRFSPADNSVTVQYQFDDNPVGYAALAGLTVGADGNLYGTTTLASTASGFFNGSVFRLRPDGSGNYTQTDVLHYFARNNGGTDYGEGRCVDPMIEVNHVLYGTCNTGGANNDGLVFQVGDSLGPPPAPAPIITPPVGYQKNTDGTAKLTINGANFVQGCTVGVTNVASGTTLTAHFISASQLTADLSHALPYGDHTVTVINPDGQSASATLTLTAPPGPTITSVYYGVNGDGTSYILVNGVNFVRGGDLNITNIYNGTTADTNLQGTGQTGTQIESDLNKLLPPGDHTVTVTNPDGQSASATLSTLGPPAVVSATEVTDTNGAMHLVISGYDFAPVGYDGGIGAQAVVTDANGDPVTATVTVPAAPPSVPNGPTQLILTLNGALDGRDTVFVFNPDGQSSLGQTVTFRAASAARPHARTSTGGARPHAAGARPQDQTAGGQPFLVFQKDMTQYRVQLFLDPKLLGDCDALYTQINAEIARAKANASPTQLLLGQVSLFQQYPVLDVTALGSGTALTGLIGQDGNGLISQDGNSLVNTNGSNIVAQGGGNIVGQGGGNLVNTNGSNIVAQGGGNIVAQGGLNLVNTNGSNATPVPAASLLGDVQASASLTGSLNIVGQGGGNIVGQGGGNFRAQAVGGSLAQDQAALSLSFFFTRHDQGPENGTGSTDALFTAGFTSGATLLLLDIRFTPGQPDEVVYKAPGVVLIPTSGTLEPRLTNPAPTLTTLSPTSAAAGGGAFTLTINGTLFTDGATVNWNGQPLQTTVVSGALLTAQVPAALVAAPGTAQVTVTNPAPGGGTSKALPFAVGAPTAPAVLHTFPAGLQMFSVPEDFGGVPLGTALSVPSPHLAVWDPAALQYTFADSLRLGRGYWARFRQPTNLLDVGAPAPPLAPFSIPLTPGWNMVGDPFPATVPLSALRVQDATGHAYSVVEANRAGLVYTVFYGFPPGSTNYTQQRAPDGSLQPYQGYWVHAFQDCTLLVPPPTQ